ncbi:hypothetical protein ACFYQA_25900 [Streptomyces sp. NPDC005774]
MADLLRAVFTRHTVTVGKSLCISGVYQRHPLEDAPAAAREQRDVRQTA